MNYDMSCTIHVPVYSINKGQGVKKGYGDRWAGSQGEIEAKIWANTALAKVKICRN